MQEIRVLQVMDKTGIRGSPIHGVSRLLQFLLPAFDGTGVRQSVCVLRRPADGVDPFSGLGFPVVYLDHGRFDPRSILELAALVKRDRIDILHCHGYGAGNFGRIAGAIRRIPVILHEHMIDPGIPSYQRIADWLLSRLAARAIAVSGPVAEFLEGPRSIAPERVTVIHNAIPDSCFREYGSEERREIAARHGLSTGIPMVGIVGRLDPVKGHDVFLEAARLLSARYDDIRFLVIGDGESRAMLERMAKDLGISARVAFLGHCPDVAGLVSLLDILVVSSYSEGFSLAAVEAMAQRKPVVATSVGGLPEVVEHDASGFLVPPGDPEELARAVYRLLADPALREAFGRRGFDSCRERFPASRAVARLSHLYHDVVAGTAATSGVQGR